METRYDQFGRPVWPEPELYDDPAPNALSLAALVCGVLAILSFCVGGAIIPAALGVLFALLSRKKRMCGQAKIGFFLSLGSLAIYVLALLFLIGTLAVTGILGPVTEKALKTDFTDPDSVAEFQEETYRLLDSLLERYSRFMPGEYAKEPAAEKPQAPVPEGSVRAASAIPASRSVNRDPEAKPQSISQDPVPEQKDQPDPEIYAFQGKNKTAAPKQSSGCICQNINQQKSRRVNKKRMI